MRKQSESTLKMKAEFVDLKKQGWTNVQIADKYGCTMPTVYRVIDAIAQETGLQREEFLDRLRSPKRCPKKSRYQKIDNKRMDVEFDKALSSIAQITSSMKQYLE